MRSLFPLTSIKLPDSDKPPQGWEERVYPGVHSDIGGGYGDTLSDEEMQALADDEQFRKEREENRASPNLPVHHAERPNLDKIQAEAPRDGLSRIPCWVMYDLAIAGGVPLQKLTTILPPPTDTHSPSWWHSASEEEKRNATWVRFSGRKNARTEMLEIPPCLQPYWQNRHRISTNGVWNGSGSERQDLASFQHESRHPWDTPNQARKTINRGTNS